ncbi:MAG: ATP-binding protein [Porticoccaceae bacterium]|nr:MAG: ATP-binding protein [Porticoccaceae bacterium]
MASDEARLEIGCGTGELARGMTELGAILIRAGVGERPRFQAELVFEELVTNALRHGGLDRDHPVEVAVSLAPEHVMLVVSDRGRPFNPLEQPDPTRATTLAEAKAGGLGIILLRKAASSLAYERANGRNRVQVVIPRT